MRQVHTFHFKAVYHSTPVIAITRLFYLCNPRGAFWVFHISLAVDTHWTTASTLLNSMYYHDYNIHNLWIVGWMNEWMNGWMTIN